jgi:hypothetical protein
MKRFLTATILLALLPPAFALDAACDPLLKASEAKLAQVAWHSVTESTGIKLEAIKVDGQFFMQMDGKWKKVPMDLDKAEKIAITQMQDGGIKVTNCKDEGSETVDGMEMTVLSYTSEIPKSGLSAANAKLYIGKDDGLPYKTSSDNTTATYRYKDVIAPK